jgi:hypothetical protein
MVQDTYTPLLSEVLKKVHNAKTKEKKVEILRQYDCEPLRMVIKSSFDPNVIWALPAGEVPFTANEAEEGTEHTVLRKEARKLYNFVKGGNDSLAGFKRENMYIQMLEGLHKNEAELLIAAREKKLHQIYKGLSAAVVKEAFGWNDQYYKSE